VASTERHEETRNRVESLMGRRPELRFQFIQENAGSVQEADVDV
jgi:topoisomerase-4 subunit B